MRMIFQEELNQIIENHQHWLNQDCEDWENMRADLSDTDLSDTDMRGARMRGAIMTNAIMRDTNLSGADLSCAHMYHVDMEYADLSCVNLSHADLNHAKLNHANLNYADMSYVNLNSADLSGANLSGADLSCADGTLSAIDFLKKHFEFTEDGIIAYKTFSGYYNPPETWVLQSGSILTENVNSYRTCDCGCGINVAPIDWVKDNYSGDIWKVLIRWEWLAGVVVPYNSDGKIRCERVELIEIIESE